MTTLREEVRGKRFPVLEYLAREKRPVDMQDLLKRLAFDVACKVSLGVEQHSLDGSSLHAAAFDVASEICARRGSVSVSSWWKVERWLGVGSEKTLKDSVQVIHYHVAKAMEEKTKKMKTIGGDDLLARMISGGYDKRTIRDMAISFIVAGRDTTLAAMLWLFWLLSQHPSIEQVLVKEVQRVKSESESNKNELGYESLKGLKLLKAILYESMRLYLPVAWRRHFREIRQQGDILSVRDGEEGVPLEEGPAPDRWFLEPHGKELELKKVCPYKFPVFQAGPRECIGKEMAMIQTQHVVASILSRFMIRPGDSLCASFDGSYGQWFQDHG